MNLQSEVDVRLHAPFKALNEKLLPPLAVQPGLSEVGEAAGHLAVAIAHFAERFDPPHKIKAQDAGSRNASVQAVVDVCDAGKHGSKLWSPDRWNSMRTSALIEWKPGEGFRWLRNAILVTHATIGTFDFMLQASRAIAWWINESGLGAAKLWKPKILEGCGEFGPTTSLILNTVHQRELSEMQLAYVVRQADGSLVMTDPADTVHFEVFEEGDFHLEAGWREL